MFNKDLEKKVDLILAYIVKKEEYEAENGKIYVGKGGQEKDYVKLQILNNELRPILEKIVKEKIKADKYKGEENVG